MKMNVMERLSALQILPKEGNFATLKVLRELQMKLSFSEGELKDLEVNQDGEHLRWNAKKGAEEKDIEMGEKAKDLIIEALERLDNEKKLTEQHFSLYEKFIKNKED